MSEKKGLVRECSCSTSGKMPNHISTKELKRFGPDDLIGNPDIQDEVKVIMRTVTYKKVQG